MWHMSYDSITIDGNHTLLLFPPDHCDTPLDKPEICFPAITRTSWISSRVGLTETFGIIKVACRRNIGLVEKSATIFLDI
jgi:hypothetical protein